MPVCPHCGEESKGADFFKQIDARDVVNSPKFQAFYLIECPSCSSVLGGTHNDKDLR